MAASMTIPRLFAMPKVGELYRVTYLPEATFRIKGSRPMTYYANTPDETHSIDYWWDWLSGPHAGHEGGGNIVFMVNHTEPVEETPDVD